MVGNLTADSAVQDSRVFSCPTPDLGIPIAYRIFPAPLADVEFLPLVTDYVLIMLHLHPDEQPAAPSLLLDLALVVVVVLLSAPV